MNPVPPVTKSALIDANLQEGNVPGYTSKRLQRLLSFDGQNCQARPGPKPESGAP